MAGICLWINNWGSILACLGETMTILRSILLCITCSACGASMKQITNVRAWCKEQGGEFFYQYEQQPTEMAHGYFNCRGYEDNRTHKQRKLEGDE